MKTSRRKIAIYLDVFPLKHADDPNASFTTHNFEPAYPPTSGGVRKLLLVEVDVPIAHETVPAKDVTVSDVKPAAAPEGKK